MATEIEVVRLPSGQGAVKLAKDELAWVRSKWKKIRKSQRKADEANNDWNRINDALNARLDSMQVWDIVQRAESKGVNLPLKDALATGKWHADEASRHIADVTLFLKMKEMGIL